MKKILIIVLFVIAIAGLLVWKNNKNEVINKQSNDFTVPLYEYTGLNWSEEGRAMDLDEVRSMNGNLKFGHITNDEFAKVVEDFFNYYDKSLLEKGWIVDSSVVADGVLGRQYGYKKGDNRILLASEISPKEFKGPEEGVVCPCKVELTVYEATLDQIKNNAIVIESPDLDKMIDATKLVVITGKERISFEGALSSKVVYDLNGVQTEFTSAPARCDEKGQNCGQDENNFKAFKTVLDLSKSPVCKMRLQFVPGMAKDGEKETVAYEKGIKIENGVCKN